MLAHPAGTRSWQTQQVCSLTPEHTQTTGWFSRCSTVDSALWVQHSQAWLASLCGTAGNVVGVRHSRRCSVTPAHTPGRLLSRAAQQAVPCGCSTAEPGGPHRAAQRALVGVVKGPLEAEAAEAVAAGRRYRLMKQIGAQRAVKLVMSFHSPPGTAGSHSM